MNRRGFLGRLSAVAGAAVVAPKVAEALDTDAYDRLMARVNAHQVAHELRGSSEAEHRLDKPVAAGSTPAPSTTQSRMALLGERGLLLPCPNCNALNVWQESATSRDVWQCPACGWIDRADRITLRCPCGDCTRMALGGPYERAVPEELRRITDSAPVGLYEVLENNQPVHRVSLNEYDVNTDGWIHHVEQSYLARVCCAVSDNRHRVMGVGHMVTRADKNVVVFAWRIEDCLEWKQQRGAAPQTLVHQCRLKTPARLLHSGQVCPYCGEVMPA